MFEIIQPFNNFAILHTAKKWNLSVEMLGIQLVGSTARDYNAYQPLAYHLRDLTG